MFDEDDNEVRPDKSRLLMSDELRGLIPTDMNEATDVAEMAQSFVIVILGRKRAGKEEPLVGSLEGIMYVEKEVELEVKVPLSDAMQVIQAAPDVKGRERVYFTFFELHAGENVTRFEPPKSYVVAGARIGSIDNQRQMCVLMLNLRPGI